MLNGRLETWRLSIYVPSLIKNKINYLTYFTLSDMRGASTLSGIEILTRRKKYFLILNLNAPYLILNLNIPYLLYY
jgi:hypothetical protein